jgi:hypothetical protein
MAVPELRFLVKGFVGLLDFRREEKLFVAIIRRRTNQYEGVIGPDRSMAGV